MPGPLDFGQFLAIPGSDHLSGPGTTTYRRWSPPDFIQADVLYQPYSNPTLRAPRLIVTGLHLYDGEEPCLGFLACPDPNALPWTGTSNRKLDHSQIYLWPRVRAMSCSAMSFGDLDRLATHRLAEELAALCRSRGRRKGHDVGELARHWIDHLSLDAGRVAKAIELTPELIRISQPAKATGEAFSTLDLVVSRIT